MRIRIKPLYPNHYLFAIAGTVQEGCKERDVRDWGLDPAKCYRVAYIQVLHDGKQKRHKTETLYTLEGAQAYADQLNAPEYTSVIKAKPVLA